MLKYSKIPQKTPKYMVGVEIDLNGEDGNIFNVMGIVARLLLKNGVKEEETRKFWKYITSSTSYEDALARVQEWAFVVYKYEETEED